MSYKVHPYIGYTHLRIPNFFKFYTIKSGEIAEYRRVFLSFKREVKRMPLAGVTYDVDYTQSNWHQINTKGQVVLRGHTEEIVTDKLPDVEEFLKQVDKARKYERNDKTADKIKESSPIHSHVDEDFEDFEIIIPPLPIIIEDILGEYFNINGNTRILQSGNFKNKGDIIFNFDEKRLVIQMALSGYAYFPSDVSINYCSWTKSKPIASVSGYNHGPVMIDLPLRFPSTRI